MPASSNARWCFCISFDVHSPVGLGKIKSVIPGGKWYLVSGLFDGDDGGADVLISSGDVELAPERKSPERTRRPDLSSSSYDETEAGIR